MGRLNENKDTSLTKLSAVSELYLSNLLGLASETFGQAAGRAAFRAHFANVRSLNMREAERARIEVPLEILAGYEFMTQRLRGGGKDEYEDEKNKVCCEYIEGYDRNGGPPLGPLGVPLTLSPVDHDTVLINHQENQTPGAREEKCEHYYTISRGAAVGEH
uniref:Uncharacterized protein n=1 Tax=Vespula pensylvanica TaxID=30213 RepID=A0A834NS66_VESPE|nr:hypothetical protein H0235_011560 [Vespula pensylvanica]